ncbi:MAG: alkaline phosphatase family protein [Rhodospirillales bacterium]
MTRTLLIGLDGATFSVLDDLTRADGGDGPVMPFVRRLMDGGYRARLRSTPHPLTPPAWVSMVTGRSPGNHGVYDFMRFRDAGEEVFFTLYDARDIKVETIWSIASRQQRSVVSLNFPMMAPPRPINGSLIPGFISWRHLRINVTPASVYERVKQMSGFNAQELAWDFERELKVGEPMSQKELEDWVQTHIPREEQWFRIAEMLLTEDRPDLFAVMFDGTDKIQHQVWHVLDPTLRPERPDDGWLRLRELVVTYFRRLDGYIERLVRLAGPQAQVFLASDHGFTGSDEVLRINQYLSERGYLTWARVGTSEEDRRRAAASFAHLDWQHTRAFCPTPSSNGICIRVARAPGAPGVRPDEYEAFRARLIDDLHALRSVITGAPMVREVLLREDVFPGAAMGDAPDLTLVLRDYGFVSVRNLAPVMVPRPMVLGTHHPDGIFIAAGPGVENATVDEISIMDVAAILLHSLGLAVPADFEGAVPDSLMTVESLMQRPVRSGPPTLALAGTAPVHADDPIPEQEREKILEQLKALGYLEE